MGVKVNSVPPFLHRLPNKIANKGYMIERNDTQFDSKDVPFFFQL